MVAKGTLSQLLKNKQSLTASYLNGSRKIAVPALRRPGSGKAIRLLGVRHNNLRKIDVDFLVLPNAEGELQVTQGIVHSVDGSKRKSHLEK